jgi:hypothetical protein
LKSSPAAAICRSSSFDGFSQNPSSFFPPLPSIYSVFTSRLGQAAVDFFLVELSFAAAVGISPTQPGGRSYGKAPEGSD